jgi:DNA-binding LacI/PurR family transcriptional regulator
MVHLAGKLQAESGEVTADGGRDQQLAKHLNISIGTVSRALNGRPDVNDETRKRVLAAAKEFGYVANQSGRNLRQG